MQYILCDQVNSRTTMRGIRARLLTCHRSAAQAVLLWRCVQAYPLREYQLKVVNDDVAQAEVTGQIKYFNKQQRKGRRVVERVFGTSQSVQLSPSRLWALCASR
jgi:hypothetical protein